MHALKLALNKRMRASDDEQGINKLRPYKESVTNTIFNATKYGKVIIHQKNQTNISHIFYIFDYDFGVEQNSRHCKNQQCNYQSDNSQI